MPKKPRENRVPIMLSDEELTSIDDWRFTRRVATRSDAIRRLCQMGLTYEAEIGSIRDRLSRVLNAVTAANDSLTAEAVVADGTAWLKNYLDQQDDLIESSLDLVLDLLRIDAVEKYLSNGEKAVPFERAEELRAELNASRERKLRAIRDAAK